MATADWPLNLSREQFISQAGSALADDRLDLAHTLCLLGLTEYPDSGHLLTILGWVLARSSNHANAETSFRHALSIDPQIADAHAGLAAVLAHNKQYSTADAHYRCVLDLNANDSNTFFNHGCTRMALGRSHEAIKSFQQAIRLDPARADALHNLGIACGQLGRWDQTLDYCQRALALNSGSWQVRFLRAMSRLALGSFAAGWDDYEARTESQDYYTRLLGVPPWDGLADHRQSIAVVPEQGVGTQIMFASCLADLAARVPNCTLGCDVRLIKLFRRSFPTCNVVAAGTLPVLARNNRFDCFIMAGSLPRIFRRSAHQFSAAHYLSADPLASRGWRKRLPAPGAEAKIGITWRGGSLAPDSRHRCTAIADWRPLLALRDGRWINLQYDATASELEEWEQATGGRFHDFDAFDKKHDFEILAGLIEALDLLFPHVNSTFHLAGGPSS